ncbi:hypothetical protein N7456_012309 [Penicillium angulare]|uniref:Azaphilone pigments biosynthesis cluster protein L N-terminal domain-containing protein n=1 Tax=Penicillium angulare TaxID=116970 RepID=A0A9W9K0M0_9EURO|nr:hypothetical protein N7456_012309 [Penicillium angulare]
MAELVGTVSAVLSLAIFAFDTSKTLHDAVTSFKSQRKAIKDLQLDLESLNSILGSVQRLAEDTRDVQKLEPLRQPLNCCLKACQEMNNMLQSCQSHSKGEHDSIRDWLRMKYNEKSFDEMKQQIASYKATLNICLGAINAENSSISEASLNEINDSILGTREDIQDQLEQLQEKTNRANQSARSALQVDYEQLKQCLESLKQAEQTANATPRINIQGNSGSSGSRAIFGTDTVRPQFDLNVADNKAGLGATMSAGVHTPETLQALLSNSRAPELALVLEALKNQPHGTNAQEIQHFLGGSRAEHSIQDENELAEETQCRLQSRIPADSSEPRNASAQSVSQRIFYPELSD